MKSENFEENSVDWEDSDFDKLDIPETEVLSADYARALKLDRHIKAHAQIAQESLYEVCKGLKEMRDNKLYKELNYSNFEEYCEKEVGLKRHMAYKYADIAEIENVESIQHLGVTKLSLLAKLDETEREQIQQNTDLNQVSVKELKSQITRLKDESTQTKKELEKVSQERDEKEQARVYLAEAYRKLFAQVEELKKKPPETVTVEDTTRIEELENQIQELKAKLDEAEQKLAEKPLVQERLPEEEDSWRISRAEFKARLKVLESALNSLTAFIIGKQKQNVDMNMNIIKVHNTCQKYFDLMEGGEA